MQLPKPCPAASLGVPALSPAHLCACASVCPAFAWPTPLFAFVGTLLSAPPLRGQHLLFKTPPQGSAMLEHLRASPPGPQFCAPTFSSCCHTALQLPVCLFPYDAVTCRRQGGAFHPDSSVPDIGTGLGSLPFSLFSLCVRFQTSSPGQDSLGHWEALRRIGGSEEGGSQDISPRNCSPASSVTPASTGQCFSLFLDPTRRP